MEENNLDKYFQEKLAGHTEEPSADVWSGISDQLPKNGAFWNKRYLLLLLLLVSLSGAGYLSYRLYEIDSRVAELEQKLNSAQPPDVAEKVKSADQKEVQNEATNSNGRSQEKAFEENAQSVSKTNVKEEEVKESLFEISSDNAKESENDAFALAASADEHSSDSENTMNEKKTNQKVAFGISNSDFSKIPGLAVKADSKNDYSIEITGKRVSSFSPTLIDSRIPESTVLPEFSSEPRAVEYYTPQKDWFLFVYGMANYTHRRITAISEGSEAVPNQLDKIENGLVTPGAGLQISRELGKSFRISAGIEYNQWIQEGSYPASVSASEIELVNNPATQNQEYNFDGEIFSSLGNSDFSSASSENPFNIGFETLSPTDQVAFEIDTRRRIDYLSIPVTFEYVYNAYPFTFTAGAGLSINRVIGSSTEYSVPDSIPDLSFTVDQEFSGAYLSFHGGVAIEYGISERMSIRLSPVYRGWMTPIFENEEIRTLPFGVAVRVGVVYRL